MKARDRENQSFPRALVSTVRHNVMPTAQKCKTFSALFFVITHFRTENTSERERRDLLVSVLVGSQLEDTVSLRSSKTSRLSSNCARSLVCSTVQPVKAAAAVAAIAGKEHVRFGFFTHTRARGFV